MKELTQQEGELLNKISSRKNPANTVWWSWLAFSLGMVCNICDKLFNIKGCSVENSNVFIKHARRHINESNLKAFL